MKLFITCVIAILLIIIGLSFGAQNDTQVIINYLIAKGTFSLPLVVAIVLMVGFLLGWLTVLASYAGLRMRYIRLLHNYRKLQRDAQKALH